MKPIQLARFNALAGYSRHPRAMLTGEELGWFEHGDERILGILIRDRTDNDYAGMVLARDELLQYRWTNMTTFEASPRRARALLRKAMEAAEMAPDEEHYQGHAQTEPIDFFTPVVAEARLSPDFKTIIEQEGFSPALGIMEPMMRWYDDVDGNFIEQFQTTGFDARVWELYLFATLIELGFTFDRTEPAPDFVSWSLVGSVAVEAVTVNPTKDKKGALVPSPSVETKEELRRFLSDYMPIKFGSALYSKLCKEYWSKEHIQGLPFVLAVQDFSAPPEVAGTRSALQRYVYGFENNVEEKSTGELVITPRRIESHQWGQKTIPSGFFFLPGAENVSAVIFSDSGTIAKFNRMGALTGFGSNRVRMHREGMACDHTKDSAQPIPFQSEVTKNTYSETWVEGLEIYHNPQAVVPLDPSLFPGAGHVHLSDTGEIKARLPKWHPLVSRTVVMTPEP